jgi:DNA-binding transcriptional MerR regulator
MRRENELLSIGEVAKLTGVSVQALRYYERKGIVKPVHIDAYSGYRYYSPDQIYFIQLIINCVNLDIPLKELAGVFNADDMSAFRDFFVRNKEIAERKAKLITASITGFNAVLERIELVDRYNLGKVYSRKYPEKTYCLKPHESPIKTENRLKLFLEMAQEMHGDNFNRITIDDNLDEILGLPDFGVIAKYSSNNVEYFIFAEVTKQMTTDNCVSLPAGTYFFRHDKESQIENAHKIFKRHIKGIDTFIIIETEEFFLSKTKTNQPIYELRLVIL